MVEPVNNCPLLDDVVLIVDPDDVLVCALVATETKLKPSTMIRAKNMVYTLSFLVFIFFLLPEPEKRSSIDDDASDIRTAYDSSGKRTSIPHLRRS